MKGFTKKIIAAVLALTLVLAVGTTCMAATWTGYFGNNDGSFWEGATGTLQNKSDGYIAKMSSVGWGGVWGGQASQKIALKKGTTYNISFQVKSSKIDKFIYVKIASGEKLATAFWVKLPKGKTVKVNKTFKAENNADQITFGFGGEAGDREGSDVDAAVRYKIFDQSKFGFTHTLLASRDCSGGQFDAATDIQVSKYSLCQKPAKVTLKKVKALGKKKVKVTYKKAKGAAGYQVQVGKVKKTTTKTTLKVKAKKKGKQAVKVRAYSKGKTVYGAWSKTKKVKVK